MTAYTAAAALARRGRAPVTCRACGESGHTSRTCGRRQAAPVARPPEPASPVSAVAVAALRDDAEAALARLVAGLRAVVDAPETGTALLTQAQKELVLAGTLLATVRGARARIDRWAKGA